jgi:hypothetical protein
MRDTFDAAIDRGIGSVSGRAPSAVRRISAEAGSRLLATNVQRTRVLEERRPWVLARRISSDEVGGYDRVLRLIAADVRGLVESDVRFADAQQRVEQHFRAGRFGTDLDETLWPVVWVQVRERLRIEHDVQSIRRCLADEAEFLKGMGEVLDRTFGADTIRQVMLDVDELVRSDSTAARQVHDARDELERISVADGPAIIVVGFCLVVIVVAVIIILQELSR